MLTFRDRSSTRRDFLTVGSMGALSLPALLQTQAMGAESQKALTTGKSVIFLMQHGGPSQIETFDPKMGAPVGNRSVTGELQTKVPGLTFGGTFPKLSQRADKLAIVRSFQTEKGAHGIQPVVGEASANANIGSIVSRVTGPLTGTGMPHNVFLAPNSVDPDGLPVRDRFGNFLGTGGLGNAYAPFVPGAGGAMQQNLRLNIARDRLDNRRALLAQVDRLRRDIDLQGSINSVDRFHEQAFDVILGGVAQAFDLSREDPRLVARYDTKLLDRPGHWQHKNNRALYSAHAKSLGKLLMLARRLCEAGCTFVTVHTEFVWDMHADVNNLGVIEGMELVSSPFDHAVSTFLDDVEARGLSEKILLVATGEMGRTPKVNAKGGRDHWGKLTPLLLAGGGMTRGQVIGQSSRDGGEPASTPITAKHVVSTIMNTVFNVPEVRLAQGIPADVMRVVTEGTPIPGLM